MKAFVDVRAACGFADGVQTSLAQIRFQGLNGLEVRSTLSEPFRKARLSERRLDYD
jgi:hypothetical protein